MQQIDNQQQRQSGGEREVSNAPDGALPDRRRFLAGAAAVVLGAAVADAAEPQTDKELSDAIERARRAALPGYNFGTVVPIARTPTFSLATTEGYGARALDWIKPADAQRLQPEICKVTTLADSGPGSLRDALEKRTGPRIVVFEIGGVIDLKKLLRIAPVEGGEGGVWIAGQSAPSPGVTLRLAAGSAVLDIQASNVKVQHLRFRGGNDGVVIGPGESAKGSRVTDVALDYCSIACPKANGAAVKIGAADSVTVQRCLIGGDYTQGSRRPYPTQPGGRVGVGIDGADRVSIWANVIVNAATGVKVNAKSSGQRFEVVSTCQLHNDAAHGSFLSIRAPEGIAVKARVSGLFGAPLTSREDFKVLSTVQALASSEHRSPVSFHGGGTLSLLARDNRIAWQQADFPLVQSGGAALASVYDESGELGRHCGPGGRFPAPVIFAESRQTFSLLMPVGAFSNAKHWDPIDDRLRSEASAIRARGQLPSAPFDPVFEYKHVIAPAASRSFRQLDLPDDLYQPNAEKPQETMLFSYLTDPAQFPVAAIVGQQLEFNPNAGGWTMRTDFDRALEAAPGGTAVAK